VNLDETHSHNGTHLLLSKVKDSKSRLRIGVDVRIHEYTAKDVLSRYRGTAKLLKAARKEKGISEAWIEAHPDFQKPNLKQPPPGFIFHTEVTALWAKHPAVQRRSCVAATRQNTPALPKQLKPFSVILKNLGYEFRFDKERLPVCVTAKKRCGRAANKTV
jgi:hypothetical protein